MLIETVFTHEDGRSRLLKVEGSDQCYCISMTYETGEVSDYPGILLDEAQRWYTEQAQALMCIGFFYDETANEISGPV